MTSLRHDAEVFAATALRGFARAHANTVREIEGGLVRARPARREVAIVVGGGSGHFPAYTGWVGPGFAHGAAVGGTFASPSAAAIVRVVREVEMGCGVLLGFGRYAGDLLNFEEAAERLRGLGIEARTIAVADDIATREGRDDRGRGIAGALVVLRMAAAAAAAGWGLDTVERIAVAANARTRTLGVAFSGCTLPGAESPLFEVPSGAMSIGLGIHGEPGLELVDRPTAPELAGLLVHRILPTAPPGAGRRVIAVLDGLGATKYEELYVLFDAVADRLGDAGLVLSDVQVGEYVTSFDMAGLSLTLTWVDNELHALWSSAVDTAGFCHGTPPDQPEDLAPAARRDTPPATASAAVSSPSLSDRSRATAAVACAALDRVVAVLVAAKHDLDALDAVAGDGDHGIGMVRGSRAAADAARAVAATGAGVAATLAAAGEAWADRAGGTSGALWGAALSALAVSLHDDGGLTPSRIAAAAVGAVAIIRRRGGAEPGDRTMVDAAAPYAAELARQLQAGATTAASLAAAALVASDAARATADLVPRRGRARTHGERAVGMPDPGAVSFALVATAVADLDQDEGNTT